MNAWWTVQVQFGLLMLDIVKWQLQTMLPPPREPAKVYFIKDWQDGRKKENSH